MLSAKNISIYNTLRSDIVDGRFRPGERLVIADIAKRYDTSPMPVREALTKLQQDGFVEVKPYVGAHVADFDAAKFDEILLIRTELESLACRLAVPHVDGALLEKLEGFVAEMAVALEDGDGKKFSKLNKKLHMAIYRASPNPILHDLIFTLWERTEYMKNLYSISLRRIHESHREHIEWLRAFRRHDADKAVAILRRQKEKQFAEYRRVIAAEKR